MRIARSTLALVSAFSFVALPLLAAPSAVAIPRAQALPPLNASIGAIDNFFSPGSVRIAPTGRVTWTNEGESPHTVTADDGSFDSGNLNPDQTFAATVPEAPVAIRYYCKYHGAPGGHGMSGIVLVGDVEAPPDESGGPTEAPPAGSVIRVPADAPSIQAAVDTASPGDLILVSPGVYHEAVKVTTPYLTIRGTDRNLVILEGDLKEPNGVHVLDANGVAVENLTARHYVLNGVYWTGVDGYRASYVTTYANGDYGVYAFDSVNGRFEHSYAGGHPDSGFYIGQCQPCHAVIDDVLAENNALGYSGTNAGGDLWIVNSEWRDNMSGITPNTLDSERLAPQHGVTIAGNFVHDNNNVDAPAKVLGYPSLGTGILVAGGNDNVVTGNVVTGQDNYGIAVFPNLDKNLWVPQRNRVEGNHVAGSGRADLVLGGPAGQGNCFAGNAFRTSLPPAIQTFAGCGLNLGRLGGGELSSTVQSLVLFAQAKSGNYPQGEWQTQPAPPPQPTMPDPEGAWTPGSAMPGLRPEVRTLAAFVPTNDTKRSEVTVLGVSLAAPTWWGLLIGVYGYVLPLVLFATWVSIAMWDLVRRDTLPSRTRMAWMAAILLIPFLGPILYFAFGKSPIPKSTRWMLTAGGFGVYLLVTLVAFLIGS